MEKKKEIVKIPWEKSIWFFDVDDTLSDTSDISSAATEGIYNVCQKHFGKEIARQLQKQVSDYYLLMVGGYRVKDDAQWATVPGGKSAYDELIQKVTDCQKDVVKKYGIVKKWSREILLKLAADNLRIRITPELVSEAVNAYWMEIAKQTTIYPDALKLVQEIKAHNRPIYLLTSSDARLQMQPDGQFLYDPSYSEALKRQRIESLREKGINFNSLSIGDPEDKPHRDFFDKAVKKAEEDLGRSIDFHYSLMFGDSFAGDLQTPKEQMGFGLVICVDRTKPHFDAIDSNQINTNDISKVTGLLI